jgi:hypothetical protein
MLDASGLAETPPGAVSEPSKRTSTQRARYAARDRQHPLRVTVSLDEKAEIQTRAKAAGLSVASYLRATALGRHVHSVLDLRAVNELVKVAGDQGRLESLLRLWLVDRPGNGAQEIKLHRVLDQIGETQSALAEIVSRV